MIGDEQVAVLNPSGAWTSNEGGIIADFTPAPNRGRLLPGRDRRLVGLLAGLGRFAGAVHERSTGQMIERSPF